MLFITIKKNEYAALFYYANSLFLAGLILMENYVSIDKYLDVQFQSFYSKLDILMYYVAVSNYTGVIGTDCKQYVSHIVFIM